MELEYGEVSMENFAGNTSRKFCIFKSHVALENHNVIADSVENFEVRDDDVWICSFPRSGTTWTQEMVWNIANNLDFKGSQISLKRRIPHFEYFKPVPNVDPSVHDVLEHMENLAKLPGTRYIKTHLAFHLLPRQLRERQRNCKIVYVSRNPKDACISYYHLHKLNFDYRGTLEDFCKAFIENKVVCTPYWNHVNGYFEMKDRENILLVRFEDMKSDLRSVIQKTARFFSKKLNDQQVEDLEKHLSFASMQKNPAVNREEEVALIYKARGDPPCKQKFLRSGEVGQWKTVMSEEWINRFDEWIKANSKEF